MARPYNITHKTPGVCPACGDVWMVCSRLPTVCGKCSLAAKRALRLTNRTEAELQTARESSKYSMQKIRRRRKLEQEQHPNAPAPAAVVPPVDNPGPPVDALSGAELEVLRSQARGHYIVYNKCVETYQQSKSSLRSAADAPLRLAIWKALVSCVYNCRQHIAELPR